MCLVLIAQDYKDQHAALARVLKEANIKYKTGKSTKFELDIDIVRYEPTLVIFNASRLGAEAVGELIQKSESRGGKPVFINIYTYEDPHELKMLSEMGVTDNFAFPYDVDMLAKHIGTLCASQPNDPDSFMKKITEHLDSILKKINPSPRQRGNSYIKEAVLLVLFKYPFKPNLHGVIYPAIAQKYSTSVKSVEHSIRISIESCWNGGNRQFLQMCTGISETNRRPSNQTFIMSLAQHTMRENRAYFDTYLSDMVNITNYKLHI